MVRTEITKGKKVEGKLQVHESVMVSEVLEAFGAHLNNQARIIDATLGTGGHTLALVKYGVNVLGIEMDPEILKVAASRLKKVKGLYTLVQGNFKDLKKVAQAYHFSEVDGILFDLGVSTIQLTSKARGFSFTQPGAPLDMRISSVGPTACDLLNILREDQLSDLFLKVLSKAESQYLAEKIIKYRESSQFQTVEDFLRVTGQVFRKRGKLHPATRAFLALRIAVNSELENLQEALPDAFAILKSEGVLAVISFHSSEDRIVKDFFKAKVNLGRARLVNEKPIVPKASETEINPRARSAKMRILKKI